MWSTRLNCRVFSVSAKGGWGGGGVWGVIAFAIFNSVCYCLGSFRYKPTQFRSISLNKPVFLMIWVHEWEVFGAGHLRSAHAAVVLFIFYFLIGEKSE